jgi:hypothetical protein
LGDIIIAMERYRYTYKDVEAAVVLRQPPEGSDIEIGATPQTPAVLLETTLLGYAIAANYGVHHKKLSVEEARRYVALEYFTPEKCGDMLLLTPLQLSRSANITQEFATYIIKTHRQAQSEGLANR